MTMRREILGMFRKTKEALEEAEARFREFYEDDDVDPDTVMDVFEIADAEMVRLSAAFEHRWLGMAVNERAKSEFDDEDDPEGATL